MTKNRRPRLLPRRCRQTNSELGGRSFAEPESRLVRLGDTSPSRSTSAHRVESRLGGIGALGSRRGLTLLETMVALAILAVGIVGVLHAFSSSLIATREAESYSVAAMLAGQVASEIDRQTTLEAGELSGTFEDEPRYSWEANVEAADENGLMRTTITVNWNADAGARQYTMVMCLRPPGETVTQETVTTPTPTPASGGG
jgi:type II secretion system protein I